MTELDFERIFFIVGQTGSGKSSLALAIARELGSDKCVILNADAFQLYRGMEILSASPSSEQKSEIEHLLYNVVEPSIEMNAAIFRTMVLSELANKRAKKILLVGGSGMYVKALTHGLVDTPIDDHARKRVTAMSDEEVAAELLNLDANAGDLVNLQNPRHSRRSLLLLLSGDKSLRELKAAWRQINPHARGIFLHRKREDLQERLRERCDKMWQAGLVQEVKALLNSAVSRTAERATGLAETKDYLAGKISAEECRQRISLASLHLAKKQKTWFKRESFIPLEVREGQTIANILTSTMRSLPKHFFT